MLDLGGWTTQGTCPLRQAFEAARALSCVFRPAVAHSWIERASRKHMEAIMMGEPCVALIRMLCVMGHITSSIPASLHFNLLTTLYQWYSCISARDPFLRITGWDRPEVMSWLTVSDIRGVQCQIPRRLHPVFFATLQGDPNPTLNTTALQ